MSETTADEQIEIQAKSLITTMQTSLDLDFACNKCQKPAINRLNKLDLIIKELTQKNLEKKLLENNVLETIKKWLEPLPDHSLPNVKIKKEILNVLYNLKVSKQDLLNSGVGKIVHFYSKNPREANDVRNMAVKLVKKWTRMVVEKDEEDD